MNGHHAFSTATMDQAHFSTQAEGVTVIGGWRASPGAGPHGGTILHDVEVFKADTFRDSQGVLKTWTQADLRAMVYHFELLRMKNILPNVPTRADHWSGIDSVAGYLCGLRTNADGDRLLADIEFTDMARLAKVQDGTYRSRSLEVGTYRTNSEEVYSPVVLGVAWVDLPAVEGLHSAALAGVHVFSSTTSPPPTKETTVKFRIAAGVETEDPTAVQAYITSLEAEVASHKNTQPFLFKLNGTESSDFAAAQAHIDALEGTVLETVKLARTAFVKGLAADGKITEPMVAGLTTVALTLGDAEYAAFKEGYEKAPKLGILSTHSGNSGQPDGQPDARATAILVAQEQVTMLERSGFSKDEIAKSKPAQELARLQAQAA